MPIGKPDAFGGQFVQVRRWDVIGTLKTEVGKSKVIREDQQDVRFCGVGQVGTDFLCRPWTLGKCLSKAVL